LQDLLMNLFERLAGFQTEFLRQDPADTIERIQRLSLSARLI
jgi:hypothetical protein